VETVGVGQTELEITGAADTVVVVLVPESGDAIQAMKAGLMEIADIFVVNKADRPGSDRLVKDLKLALHLREGEALKDVPAHHGVDLKRLGVEKGDGGAAGGEPASGTGGRGTERRWKIPVLSTVAQSGEGLEAVMEAVQAHRDYLEASGVLAARRRERARGRVRDVVEREFRKLAWSHPDVRSTMDERVEAILSGQETPYSLGASILNTLLKEP
jgi:LAO/AO transport system kinase